MKPRILLLFILSLVWFSLSSGQDTKENADYKLAVNLYNDKLYDLALEQFRQFVAAYPNTQQGTEARFYLGLCQMNQGKYDDARLTFQNFALAFPDHPRAPEAWWNVADSYVALKNVREAALAFERVKTFHPRSKLAPSALVKASEYFDLAGDPESSRKVLRTLIQDYASSDVILPARLRLARMYLSDNQFELARVESKRVADGSKDPVLTAEALVLLARSLSRLNKSDEARQALDTVVKTYKSTPSYYTALLALGTMQRDMGYAGKALDTWRLTDLDSAQAPPEVRQSALLERGDGFLLRGNIQEARTSYEKAAAIPAGGKVEALYKAGLAAERAGALPAAQSLLATALADSSSGTFRADLLLASARIAAAAQSYGDAIRFYSLFRDQYPRDPRVADAIYGSGKIYLDRLHDYQQALSQFESLISGFPSSALVDDAMFGEAEALRLSGVYDRAIAAYQDLMNRFPASDFAGSAAEAAFRVRTFDLKNKESGLEKLALLVGDVIAQQSKGELAFRLADIYFHDLKDYGKAAPQYASALKLGLPPDNVASAWYNQGQSYEYLALLESLEGAPRADRLISALAAYDSLVRQSPSSELADDALTSQLRVRLELAAGGADVRSVSTEFLLAHPLVKRRDQIYYMIGEAFRKKKSFDDAAWSYRQTLKERPLKDVEGNALFRLGQMLNAIGRSDTAAVVFGDYLKKYPNSEFSAAAAWALGQSEAAAGNAPRALELYALLSQQFPYTSYASRLDLARADAYNKGGDYVHAAAQYDAVIRSSETLSSAAQILPLDVYYNAAVANTKLGKRAEARQLFASYLMRDDTTERAGQVYYQLGTLAREDNDVALAAEYLQKASQFSQSGSGGVNQAALEAGELYFKNEEYTNALSRYAQALEKSVPDSLRQYVETRIIVSYLRLNNIVEANTRIAAFLKAHPKQDRYLPLFEYERGMYALRKDDYTGAKRAFDLVLQKYAGSTEVPNALYGNARVDELAGRTAEAIKSYEDIIQRYAGDPIAPRAHLALGNLYYSKEQWDPAARQYKAILDSESRAPDLVQFAMNNLILAYKQLSMFDAALDLTRKYLDRFPDDPDRMNKRIDIGVLYQRLGYYDQSVVHLQSLLENADADVESEVRYDIGEAYFSKGDYQQAILEFLKVPYLVTKKTKVDWASTSYYMAGQAYEKMSKFEQAITMYKQILSRPGVDATFKTGAQREIDRVTELMKSNK